jgi:hypothetical protein
MPGGAALAGPASYTHLNPYELAAIIRRNSTIRINPFLVGLNDAEGIFFHLFLMHRRYKEVRT